MSPALTEVGRDVLVAVLGYVFGDVCQDPQAQPVRRTCRLFDELVCDRRSWARLRGWGSVVADLVQHAPDCHAADVQIEVPPAMSRDELAALAWAQHPADHRGLRQMAVVLVPVDNGSYGDGEVAATAAALGAWLVQQPAALLHTLHVYAYGGDRYVQAWTTAFVYPVLAKFGKGLDDVVLNGGCVRALGSMDAPLWRLPSPRQRVRENGRRGLLRWETGMQTCGWPADLAAVHWAMSAPCHVRFTALELLHVSVPVGRGPPDTGLWWVSAVPRRRLEVEVQRHGGNNDEASSVTLCAVLRALQRPEFASVPEWSLDFNIQRRELMVDVDAMLAARRRHQPAAARTSLIIDIDGHDVRAPAEWLPSGTVDRLCLDGFVGSSYAHWTPWAAAMDADVLQLGTAGQLDVVWPALHRTRVLHLPLWNEDVEMVEDMDTLFRSHAFAATLRELHIGWKMAEDAADVFRGPLWRQLASGLSDWLAGHPRLERFSLDLYDSDWDGYTHSESDSEQHTRQRRRRGALPRLAKAAFTVIGVAVASGVRHVHIRWPAEHAAVERKTRRLAKRCRPGSRLTSDVYDPQNCAQRTVAACMLVC